MQLWQRHTSTHPLYLDVFLSAAKSANMQAELYKKKKKYTSHVDSCWEMGEKPLNQHSESVAKTQQRHCKIQLYISDPVEGKLLWPVLYSFWLMSYFIKWQQLRPHIQDQRVRRTLNTAVTRRCRTLHSACSCLKRVVRRTLSAYCLLLWAWGKRWQFQERKGLCLIVQRTLSISRYWSHHSDVTAVATMTAEWGYCGEAEKSFHWLVFCNFFFFFRI